MNSKIATKLLLDVVTQCLAYDVFAQQTLNLLRLGIGGNSKPIGFKKYES